jgi:hypothetical protein
MSNRQNKICYVGNYPQEMKEQFRQDVCRDLPTNYEVNNNDYCLLHAPTIDKDKQEFESVFSERISRNDSYFQTLVFPIPLDLTHHNFTLPLNFSHATFLSSVDFYKIQIKYVYFDYARFHARAQFHRSHFSELATFTGAIFYREAWFTGSHFKASKFDHVTFNGETRFNSWVKFVGEADFG